MVTRSSSFSKAPALAVSSVCTGSSPAIISDRDAVWSLLPGRRRLMREEDSSGTDSGEEPPTSLEGDLRTLGVKRPAPACGWGRPLECGKRVCILSFPPVPASSGDRVVESSGASDSSPDVIYVKTERASLSQTLLTSWLVRNA